MTRLRIIGGELGGRMIRVPRGGGVRPTTDRVREALYNMVAAILGDLTGRRVLDLYAGSGALGLEALSRGAARAVLVERDRSCQRVIQKNAADLQLSDRCRVLRLDVDAALSRLDGDRQEFGLVLADPPYRDPVEPLLQTLGTSRLLSADGVFVLEHTRRVEPPDRVGALAMDRRRRYGDTVLSVYRGRPRA